MDRLTKQKTLLMIKITSVDDEDNVERFNRNLKKEIKSLYLQIF